MNPEPSKEVCLLKDAVVEIRSLRRQNDLMKARLDMFDSMNAILHTQVAHRNEGMSPDLVWEIEKFIDTSARLETACLPKNESSKG